MLAHGIVRVHVQTWLYPKMSCQSVCKSPETPRQQHQCAINDRIPAGRAAQEQTRDTLRGSAMASKTGDTGIDAASISSSKIVLARIRTVSKYAEMEG